MQTRSFMARAAALMLALGLSACDDAVGGGGDETPDAGIRDMQPMVLVDMAPAPDAAPDVAPLDMAPLDMAPLDMAPAPDAAPDMAPLDMAPDMAAPDVAPPDMAPDLLPPDAGPPASCGDGVLDADEACDDGDLAPGDGCDAFCRVEAGWRCDSTDLEPLVVEVDGLTDCADTPVRPALAPWAGWRAVYVGGAVLYSANDDPWSHRFDVRVDRGGRDQAPLSFMVGEGRYASAEEAEDAGLGRATDPFVVGHRDGLAVWFPDAQCAGNEGTLTVRFEAVSACRPDGVEVCDNGLDDDGDLQVDCAQDACVEVCTPRFCGDAFPDPGEGCDDGAREDGDGCSADCRVEPDFACERWPAAEVEASIDAFDHCVPGSPEGVAVPLEPGAWRAYYVGGAALFSINADPWAARFGVRVRGPDGARQVTVGEGRFPSAEAASAAVEGRFSAVFVVGPDDAVDAFFLDDNCNRNDGTIEVLLRRVAECAPADGIR